MENNSYTTSDRLDYLEFRQNLLILKQPCHKATVFFDLTIDIYLKMKEKSEEFSENVKNGKNLKLLDYENKVSILRTKNVDNFSNKQLLRIIYRRSENNN